MSVAYLPERDLLSEGQHALADGYHHREFEDRDWESVMIGGLPHWRPPAWIDQARTPVLHHRITLNNRRE